MAETERVLESEGVDHAAPRPLLAQPRYLWGVAWRIVMVALVLVAAIWAIFNLTHIVLQVLVAIILATGLTPMVEWLHRRHIPRPVSVLIIYLGFLLAIAGVLALIIPPLVDQVRQFVESAPELGQALIDQYAGLRQQFSFLPPPNLDLGAQFANLLSQAGSLATQFFNVVQVVLSLFTSLLNVVLTLLIAFYLVVDGPRIRRYFLSFLKESQRERVTPVLDRIGEKMGGWLLGQILLSASIGLASYVALTILGIRGALLLAVIAAIGEIVPIIGPWLSAIPAVLVAFTDSPLKALLVIVAYLIIQQLESNLLAPYILGRAVQLHPLAIIVALLIGGALFGIVGALVAVPVTAALSVVLDAVRQARGEPSPAQTADKPAPTAPPGTSD